MESEVIRMILQAKRLFVVKADRKTFDLLGINKEEVYFWFSQMYSDQLDKYRSVIEDMFREQVE